MNMLEGDDDFALGPDVPPGAPLPPFRPSITLQRTRFSTTLSDDSTATVDVDHATGRAALYVDDRHVRSADMPVQFDLDQGRIDVVASKFGMQRIHLVEAGGSARQLAPAPGTPEHWRARLSERHPRLGRFLAGAAVVVLTVNLALLAPQLLEVLTHIPAWADRFASFTSPISLPAAANTALAGTAALAGIERALTLRHHRILDIETDGIDT